MGLLSSNEEPPIFHLLGTRNEEPPLLPSSWPEEWTKNPPGTSSSDPSPGHQLPSAILRSGSSDRSSTLKIGPKIEIGSYSATEIAVVLSSRHRRCSVGPSAAENTFCIGKLSLLSPVTCLGLKCRGCHGSLRSASKSSMSTCCKM